VYDYISDDKAVAASGLAVTMAALSLWVGRAKRARPHPMHCCASAANYLGRGVPLSDRRFCLFLQSSDGKTSDDVGACMNHGFLNGDGRFCVNDDSLLQ
jgi:hypothetical protein